MIPLELYCTVSIDNASVQYICRAEEKTNRKLTHSKHDTVGETGKKKDLLLSYEIIHKLLVRCTGNVCSATGAVLPNMNIRMPYPSLSMK